MWWCTNPGLLLVVAAAAGSIAQHTTLSTPAATSPDAPTEIVCNLLTECKMEDLTTLPVVPEFSHKGHCMYGDPLVS